MCLHTNTQVTKQIRTFTYDTSLGQPCLKFAKGWCVSDACVSVCVRVWARMVPFLILTQQVATMRYLYVYVICIHIYIKFIYLLIYLIYVCMCKPQTHTAYITHNAPAISQLHANSLTWYAIVDVANFFLFIYIYRALCALYFFG